MRELLPYIMIAFVCRGGGELDITQGEVRGAGFTPHRHKLTTSKRTQIRIHGVTTTVMTHRLGLNAKLPPEDSIFIPVLGPEGGGLSSSVREYSMEADGLAQGGYSMKPDGDFELITTTDARTRQAMLALLQAPSLLELWRSGSQEVMRQLFPAPSPPSQLEEAPMVQQGSPSLDLDDLLGSFF
jgi:hypothetical protein